MRVPAAACAKAIEAHASRRMERKKLQRSNACSSSSPAQSSRKDSDVFHMSSLVPDPSVASSRKGTKPCSLSGKTSCDAAFEADLSSNCVSA